MVAGLLAFSAFAGEATYHIADVPRMDRLKLQIGTYCLAARHRDEAHVKEIRDCGIDFIYGIPATDRNTLDICAKHGLGVIATGAVPFWHGMGGKEAGLMKTRRPLDSYAAALEKYADHPAIWMLDYVDEPSAADFPWIAEVTRLMQEKDPAGVTPYINLYPNYASVVGNTAKQTVSQLGTATYAEHVEAYMKNVPLDYVCFDFYVYSAKGKEAFAKKLEKFHENFKDLSDACRKYGKSLWFIPQVNSSYGELWLSENMLRFQAYLSMAYGTEVINWACWGIEGEKETPDMPGLNGWWTNNVLTLTGERTQQYDKLKTVNAELHRLGEHYMKYRNVATRRIGENAFTVGDMVARDGSGKRAMFVLAAGDPFDEHPYEQRFTFAAASARAFGGNGEIPVGREADGSLSVTLPANAGALIEYEPVFRAAEPVWHAGHETEMNEQLSFRGVFEWRGGKQPVMRLASSNPYRVRLNGRFAWYGPARGPKGFFRVDEVPLPVKVGANLVEIECAGYNCANFYFQKQPSFLQAEVVMDDGRRGDGEDAVATQCKVVLRTAAKAGEGALSTCATGRVRKVSRYSHARAFGEAYVLPEEKGAALPLAVQPDVALLPRIVSAPDFSVADDFLPVAGGACPYDGKCETKKVGFIDGAGKPGMDGYPKGELVYDLWDGQQRFRPVEGPAPAKADAYALAAGEHVRFEAPKNRTGFPSLTVKCREPGELHVLFDEHPVPKEFKPWRSVVANHIVWKFEKPGEYEVEAFEPYVLKVLEVVAKGGRFEVSAPRLRLYRNADSRRASFRSSDPELDALFAAAEENFAQNAVDGFMDCPGRERAGWNCDAFFTSRAAALLSGNVLQETVFFDDFARPPHFDNVDRGMIPMCYPSDFSNGNYIPSWAMFFVLQLDEYARLRGGDPALVEMLKPRVLALVDFLSKYRNADGLLENLPRWVFVEWSKANDFVKGVNYPNNMIWAATLEAIDRLYGRPELAAEAVKMKETIRRQSWTGEWFRDQAIRQKDGALKLTPESTETCQYYAFYFGTATKELYPELYRKLTTEFGPRRIAEKRYPEIHESAPFIGNFMRLDWLGREGFVRKQCEETKGYFGYMVRKTGTVWENANSETNGSCCHGFASHAAVFIVRDAVGVKAIDRAARKVAFAPPEDSPLEHCELTLPVGAEKLTLGWRMENGRRIVRCDLPSGWVASR